MPSLQVRGIPLLSCTSINRKVKLDLSGWYVSAPWGQELTHLWNCVLTDSGATRRPRVPIPKGTSGKPLEPWGPQTEKGPNS